MAVHFERPNSALLTYDSFMERGSEVEQEAARFWGIQVVVLGQESRVFLRRDPDGHKLEGHIGGETVYFPNTRNMRFNGVSGGAGFWEDPVFAQKSRDSFAEAA